MCLPLGSPFTLFSTFLHTHQPCLLYHLLSQPIHQRSSVQSKRCSNAQAMTTAIWSLLVLNIWLDTLGKYLFSKRESERERVCVGEDGSCINWYTVFFCSISKHTGEVPICSIQLFTPSNTFANIKNRNLTYA